MEPRDRGLAIRVEAARRTPEAVLLRRPQGEALPPPGEERTPCLRLRVGNRAGHGAGRLRTVGQGAGIKGLGRGQLALGSASVCSLVQRASQEYGSARSLLPLRISDPSCHFGNPLSLGESPGDCS